MLVLMLVVVVNNIISIWLSDLTHLLPTWQATIVETLLDIALAVPLLYFFGLRSLLRENTRRTRAEAELRESEERFRLLVEGVQDYAILMLDTEGRITSWNTGAQALKGWQAGEIIGQHFSRLYLPEDVVAGKPERHLAKAAARDRIEDEGWRVRKDGSRFWANFIITALRDAKGHLRGFAKIARDLTEPKRAESRIERLIRLYAMLSQVNQTVVRAKEPDELFRTICQVAVDFGKFGPAWIGLIDRETGDVTTVAVYGAMHDRLPFQKINHRERPFVDGLLGKAVSSGNVVYSQDVQTDPAMQPWREEALAGNYHAAAAVPFRLKGEIFGILVLLATEVDFFADEEQDKLLTETALDISFALEGMERERDRKRAEEALRTSEIRYRRLFESAKDGILILDAETGMVVDVNPFMTEMLGCSREAFLDKRVWELGFFKSIIANQARFMELQQKEYIRYQDLPLEGSDGRSHEVEFISNVYQVNDRKVIQCNIRDITERKRAQQEWQRLVTLVENSPDFIGLAEQDGKVSHVNAAGRRLVGLRTEEELKGKTAFDFFAAEDLQRFRTEVMPARMQGGRWQGEIRFRNFQTGCLIPVEMNAFVISDPETGQPAGLATICRDLTEKKSLERQFLRTQRLEGLGNLASGIAHDLNNILAPILMSAQLLQLSHPDEDAENILATIVGSANRGADVVKQVLTFARGVEGERVPVHPKYLIKELEKIFRETFPKNITFRSEAPKGLWIVTGDATQLHQVLLNLCVNARDAMPDGGTLVLSAENVQVPKAKTDLFAQAKAGPHVLMRVSDTGEGIPPAIMERIFEPFFTTKGQGKGTGLGLSTVLGIVRSHGGFVDVESEPGRGSTFKVYLPAQPAEETEHLRRAPAASPRGSGEWVLVVDDEANIRDMTRTTLLKHGYEVLVAANGKEALDLLSARADQVKAVVTDIVMPVMDGEVLVRAMKESCPQTPVIACSGWGQEDLQAQLRALGVKTFLEKPYEAAELLAALHEYLNAAS